MKIGIYKPHKAIYFHDDTNDYASWSNETINISKILIKYQKAQIYILSETDLKEKIIQNFQKGMMSQHYDRIIVFNGGIEENHEQTSQKLRKLTTRLDYIVTDMKLRNYDESLFDNIYTQSAQLHKYGAIEKACVFNYQKPEDLEKELKNKKIHYCFGGAEHNRLDDFIEYIWRPECKRYGKSVFFDIDNRVSYSKFTSILTQTKYSIAIADKEYNDIGFVTPRFFECLMQNVICFADRKYDPDELLLSHNDFLRVSSFKEMKQKMNNLDKDIEETCKILKKQQEKMMKYADGQYIYNLIK